MSTANRHTFICQQTRWVRSECSLNLFLLTAWPFAIMADGRPEDFISQPLFPDTKYYVQSICITWTSLPLAYNLRPHHKAISPVPHRKTFHSCQQSMTWEKSHSTGNVQPQTVIRLSSNKYGEFVPNAHWICSCWPHDHLPGRLPGSPEGLFPSLSSYTKATLRPTLRCEQVFFTL